MIEKAKKNIKIEKIKKKYFNSKISPRPIKESGEKLICSDFSLDHWISQTYGIELENWPK